MKNRLDLTRFPRRANADSTCRARVSNAHCTRRTAKSHADPTRSNTQARKMRLSWGFVARSRLLCENGCSPQGCETRAIGAAGAQVPYKDKVGGSNPSSPTIGYEKGRRMFRRPFFRRCQQRINKRMFHVKHSQRSAMAAPHTHGAAGGRGLGERRYPALLWRDGNFGAWASLAAPIARCARRGSARGAPAGPQARPRTKEPGQKRELRRTGPGVRPRDETRRNRTTKRQLPTSRPSGPNPSCRGWRRRPLPRGTGWPPSRTARSGGGTSRIARA